MIRIGKGALLLVIGIIALAWIIGTDEERSVTSRQTTEVTVEQASKAGFDRLTEYRDALAAGIRTKAEWERKKAEEAFFALPPDQVAFVAAVADARDAYRAAPNDLAKGGTRAARAQAICRAIKSRAVESWSGTIADLSSNSEGKGVLRISIGKDVSVATWNNALSDIMSGTLIEPNTTLFRKLATLKKGQRVKFSGSLLPDDTDCVREQSVTLGGSMRNPYFLMRFRTVETMPQPSPVS